MRQHVLLVLLFVTSCVAVSGCQSTPVRNAQEQIGPIDDPALAPRGEIPVTYEPGECALCDLYHNARYSVIRIDTPGGLGAGVIVDDRGYAITNAHVVGDRPVIQAQTSEGESTPGRVVFAAPDIDLAIVALAPVGDGWKPMRLADAARPEIGSDVYVIGHPVGLGWSLSRGIVSGFHEGGTVGKTPLIQTDAAISPGNSGGPLVNGNGQILGIVVSKLAGRGAENLAFVIPAAEVAEFASEHIPE